MIDNKKTNIYGKLVIFRMVKMANNCQNSDFGHSKKEPNYHIYIFFNLKKKKFIYCFRSLSICLLQGVISISLNFTQTLGWGLVNESNLDICSRPMV